MSTFPAVKIQRYDWMISTQLCHGCHSEQTGNRRGRRWKSRCNTAHRLRTKPLWTVGGDGGGGRRKTRLRQTPSYSLLLHSSHKRETFQRRCITGQNSQRGCVQDTVVLGVDGDLGLKEWKNLRDIRTHHEFTFGINKVSIYYYYYYYHLSIIYD